LPAAAEHAGPSDIAALLQTCLEQAMPLADSRRIDLGFERRASAVVDAPGEELRSVFDNLIDNALRYSPQGSGVDVRLHPIAGRPVVDVIDAGPGIPSALKPGRRAVVTRAGIAKLTAPSDPVNGARSASAMRLPNSRCSKSASAA